MPGVGWGRHTVGGVSLPSLPSRARIVIIGGGVIGTSIAYHLAHAGESDVLVLERDKLTSGTTWHAAGLMTCFGSTSETSTRMRLYSRDLYARLEAETGVSTGFKPVGLIEAAADRDRLEEYRRVAAFQRHIGLEVHEIGPAEMADLFPLARTDDLLAGFYVPRDGRVNPVDLTMSLARGAKNLGVRVVEGVSVEQVLTRPDGARERTTGVRAAYRGETLDIECDIVVNCAGMWARELGERNGLVIPNQAAEHYYLITDHLDGMSPDAPVFEDPASYGYYREEGGGMMVGLFEPVAAPWRVNGIPRDFSFGEITPDWERMGPFVEKAMARVPATLDVGVRTFFCGPESFMPDLAPAVGESGSIGGYFVCAGLNSVGILSSGGLGRIMAHWILTGRPDVDVTGFNVDRFRAHQLALAYRAARTAEILGTVYAAHTPGIQLASGRGVFASPVLDRMVAQGAYLRDVSGWESADWYAGRGVPAQAEPGWGVQPWFAHWEAEHRCVREAVGLMDMSFMAKFEVTGADAGRVLSRLSTADVDGAIGEITYTQWLAEDGGIEADLTVTKLAEDRFLVVASDTAHGHTLAWLRRGIGTADVEVRDITTEWAMFTVQGPLSRAVLAAACPGTDFANEAFPFRSVREVVIDTATGPVRALAARITYLGELGWEVYVPREGAGAAYDALLVAGGHHGIRPVGLKALSSLRLEKGYRDFGHDIDNTDSLVGVGLAFTAALDKPGGFVGREAVVAAKAAGMPRARLVQVLLLDPEPLLYHAEPVLRDSVVVGYVRSASYGWTLGGAVGLAFVEADEPVSAAWLAAGTWEVDVAGVRHPARVSLRPMYDPGNERIRA